MPSASSHHLQQLPEASSYPLTRHHSRGMTPCSDFPALPTIPTSLSSESWNCVIEMQRASPPSAARSRRPGRPAAPSTGCRTRWATRSVTATSRADPAPGTTTPSGPTRQGDGRPPDVSPEVSVTSRAASWPVAAGSRCDVRGAVASLLTTGTGGVVTDAGPWPPPRQSRDDPPQAWRPLPRR